MSLYATDKLINETRRLAAEFKRTTGTMLPVSGEIARYDVSHHLNLTLCKNTCSGYDATGNEQRKGQRIQIKSRVIGDSVKSGHRVGQLNTNGQWDIVILSLMNNVFEPMEMYQLSREKFINTLNVNNKNQQSISVAKFKVIGDLVWSSKIGVIDLPDSNMLTKDTAR